MLRRDDLDVSSSQEKAAMKSQSTQPMSACPADLPSLTARTLAAIQKPAHLQLAERGLKIARDTLAAANEAHRARCNELCERPTGSPMVDEQLAALGRKVDEANAGVSRARRDLEAARASFKPTFFAAIEDVRLAAGRELLDAADHLECAMTSLGAMRIAAERNGLDLPNTRTDCDPAALRALARRLGVSEEG
jgi:hypothetical protein